MIMIMSSIIRYIHQTLQHKKINGLNTNKILILIVDFD